MCFSFLLRFSHFACFYNLFCDLEVLFFNVLTFCILLQAEREVKRAQEEFERQIEITKLLLEGLSSAQVGFKMQIVIMKS